MIANYTDFESAQTSSFLDIMNLFLSKGKIISEILSKKELSESEWLTSYIRWQNFIIIAKDLITHIESYDFSKEEMKFVGNFIIYIKSLDLYSTKMDDKFKRFQDIKQSFEKMQTIFDVK